MADVMLPRLSTHGGSGELLSSRPGSAARRPEVAVVRPPSARQVAPPSAAAPGAAAAPSAGLAPPVAPQSRSNSTAGVVPPTGLSLSPPSAPQSRSNSTAGVPPGQSRAGPSGRSAGSKERAKEKTSQKAKQEVWTPWKDRIAKTGHRDAVIYLRALNARASAELEARSLLTAAADGTIRIFDLNQQGSVPIVRDRLLLQPPPDPETRASPSKNLFCTAFDCHEEWEKPVGDARRIGEEGDDAEAVVKSKTIGAPSSQTLVLFAGYDCGRVVGWEVSKGRSRAIGDMFGHEGAVTAVRCERKIVAGDVAGEACVVSASVDGTVRVWSLQSEVRGQPGGRCLFALEFGRRNPVGDFVLLHGGGTLLAACWDGAVRCTDLRNRRCASLTQASSSGLRAIWALPGGAPPSGGGSCGEGGGLTSPNEDLEVYVGTEDGGLSSWHFSQLGPMTEICSWKAHASQVSALRKWKTWLISASEDRAVRIWLPSTGQLLEEFRGHVGGVLQLSISERDKLVWSGSRDWTVRSWDLAEVEVRVWEKTQMAKVDAQSLAYEVAMRAHVRALRKQKKGRSKSGKGGKKSAAAKTGKSPSASKSPKRSKSRNRK